MKTLKLLGRLFLMLMFVSLLNSCRSDDNNGGGNSEEIVNTYSVPITGIYHWKFEIPMMGEQVSIHDFQGDIIHYKMEGNAYNVTYDMEVLGYDTNMKKIVAKGTEGGPKANKYFAIFLKNIESNSVVIYKGEYDNLETAQNMSVPSDDDTNFHGWNEYTKVQ